MMYANMDVSVVCRNINCWHYILMASLLARSTLVLEEKTPQTSRWQQSVFISQNRKAEDGQAVVMVNHFHTILTDISTSTGEYVWLNVSTWSFGSGRRNKEARGEKWRPALKGFKLWTLHSHAPICSAQLPMRRIFFQTGSSATSSVGQKEADWCQRYERHHEKPGCSLTGQPAVFRSLNDSPAIAHVLKKSIHLFYLWKLCQNNNLECFCCQRLIDGYELAFSGWHAVIRRGAPLTEE